MSIYVQFMISIPVYTYSRIGKAFPLKNQIPW